MEIKSNARTRILDSASRLFYQHGIHTVGVDRIIAAASVAKMTFYKHFPSKDNLIEEVVKQKDANWRDSLQDFVYNASENPRERLSALFDYLLNWFGDENFRGCQFLNTTVDLADRAHPGFAAVITQQQFRREFITQLAEGAGIPDPQELAEELCIVIAGAIMIAYVMDSIESAKRAKRIGNAIINRHLDLHNDNPASSTTH